jgi:O-antigen/teichoic acid export membrane protein
MKLHAAIVIGVIASGADRFIVIASLPKEVAGQYWVAFSAVFAGMSVVVVSTKLVFLPYFSGQESEALPRSVEKSLRYCLLISLIIIAIGSAILPALIPLIYGQMYLPAVNISLFVLMAQATLPIQTLIQEALRSQGYAHRSTFVSLSVLAVMFVFFLFGGYADVYKILFANAVANLAAAFVGLYFLKSAGLLKTFGLIVPKIGDLRRLYHFVQSIRR